MKKSDPKVKKTLVRNCEQNIRLSRRQVVHDVDSGCVLVPVKSSQKENELSQPTLCSSEALANYLSEVKSTVPPPLSAEDLNVDKRHLSSKITKKLNFHFNDRIYKNLVELNSSIEDLKTKKDKRPLTTSNKKDLEPNIEDFCEDDSEPDSPPKVPAITPRFKPVKKVEDGSLHKLVSTFEVL